MHFTRVTTPNGRKLVAFVPRKPGEMTKGLSEREWLSVETGMLFDFGSMGDRSMTTASMRFGLDLVFLDSGKNVKRVERWVGPGRQVTGPAHFVLELVAGAVELYGISVGSRLSWERPTK